MAATRIYILRAAQDSSYASWMLDRLNKQEEVKAEVFDLAKVKARKGTGTAWYIALLAPELWRHRHELDWVMEQYPARMVPVLVRDCNPEQLNPQLEYLTRYDCRSQDVSKGLPFPRDWTQGSCREKAETSLIMFLSLKGGVAKTTTSVAVAEFLAEQGNRVLVIDTDHQCGASAMLLGEDRLEQLEELKWTLSELFREALESDFKPDRIAKFAAQSTSIRGLGNRLHVIPGSLRLEDFWSYFQPTEKKVAATKAEAFDYLKEKRKEQFARWLKANYDYVFIDCPPAIAWQVRIFLLAAEGYVVPSIPDRLSVRGARYLSRRLRGLSVKIRPVGLVWTMVRKIETHDNYVREISTGQERLAFEPVTSPELPQPFRTTIPHAVSIIRAQTGTEPPLTFKEKYEPASMKVIRELCRELLARCSELPAPQTESQTRSGGKRTPAQQ